MQRTRATRHAIPRDSRPIQFSLGDPPRILNSFDDRERGPPDRVAGAAHKAVGARLQRLAADLAREPEAVRARRALDREAPPQRLIDHALLVASVGVSLLHALAADLAPVPGLLDVEFHLARGG